MLVGEDNVIVREHSELLASEDARSLRVCWTRKEAKKDSCGRTKKESREREREREREKRESFVSSASVNLTTGIPYTDTRTVLRDQRTWKNHVRGVRNTVAAAHFHLLFVVFSSLQTKAKPCRVRTRVTRSKDSPPLGKAGFFGRYFWAVARETLKETLKSNLSRGGNT